MAPAQTIADIIRSLDNIIDRAWEEKSRLGYFAALYRRVTRSVASGIAAGQFQNGPLMERLDVAFASRYVDAITTYQSGGNATRSWMLAFDAANDPAPLIVQQLLLGMNAHINLDLGIAAAAVSAQRPDFDHINAVLAGEVGAVERELAEVSPSIGLLEQLGLRTETRIINFDLLQARDLAWLHGQQLGATPPDRLQNAIGLIDVQVELFGRLVLNPPPPFNLKLLPLRLPESNDIRHILDVLRAT